MLNSTLQVASMSVIMPFPNQDSGNYTALGKVRSLSESKRKHLQQMYKDFIPTDRHLHISYYISVVATNNFFIGSLVMSQRLKFYLISQ